MNALNKSNENFKISNWEFLATGTNDKLVQQGIVKNYFESTYRVSTAIKSSTYVFEENQIIIDQVRSYINLSDNWDNEGAMKIEQTTIGRAIHWVHLVNAFGQIIYFCSPGPNGEIMLLLKGKRKEIELIIYPEKEKFVKFESKNFVEQGNLSTEIFTSIIDWFKKIK